MGGSSKVCYNARCGSVIFRPTPTRKSTDQEQFSSAGILIPFGVQLVIIRIAKKAAQIRPMLSNASTGVNGGSSADVHACSIDMVINGRLLRAYTAACLVTHSVQPCWQGVAHENIVL